MESDVARVSVVIGTYNHRRYILRAIRSVLDQTRTPHEVIIIDDGSTDDTGELIRREFWNHVIYHYQENRGPGAARNTGIRLSSGDWIAFLDADDYWMPEKLELQTAELTRCPEVRMVACEGLDCSPDGEVLRQFTLPQPLTGKTIRAKLKLRCLFELSGVLVRRDVFTHLGDFSEDMRWGEDHEMFTRIAASYEIGAVHRLLFKKTSLSQGLCSNPEFMLDHGPIAMRKARELLGRRSWPGRWLDDLALRHAEARLFRSVAELYRDRQEMRKAAWNLIRAFALWPFWSLSVYKFAAMICFRLLLSRRLPEES